jgi:hypothetical protein
MTDARLFEHWVLRHPRRFAAKVGWCPKGAEIVEAISQVVAETLGRISMAEKIRTEDDRAAGPQDGDDLLEVMSQAFKRLSQTRGQPGKKGRPRAEGEEGIDIPDLLLDLGEAALRGRFRRDLFCS